MLKNFRTYNLSVAFYRQVGCIKLPGHLKAQLQRAASSIVLNLAEGHGRQSQSEQSHFFSIAFGSLRECQAVLDLVGSRALPVAAEADCLAAHLYKLMRSAS